MGNELEESDNFLSKKSFSQKVELFVYENKVSYMDAIVHLCEVNKIEVEDVKKYLNNSIVGQLEAEARTLNFLPTMNTLDV
jgi:hypothetical protein